MKKIYSLITLSLIWLSSMNLFAFTISATKSYILIQTLGTSSKVVGVNGTTPSVMSADVSALSQRLTFEIPASGIYRIKNGDGNYITCNSSGVIGLATSNSSADTKWNIADIGTSGYISINSFSLPTSYLTSATVITGPAAFTGNPLTLTTTAPTGDATTAMSSSAFRLVEAPTAFANGLADGGFENVTANTANLSAPLGEWINDKSKNIGGGSTSRVVSTYAIAGTKNFMLRFIAISSNGYYNISHKLNGLIAGNSYTFSFKYRVDDGANTNTFAANSQANIYAANTANDVVANSIGGSSNYYTTSQPSTNITSQTATTGNVTFIAPASSCYIVFSKVVQADAPAFYVYMDDMALIQNFLIAASANDVAMGSVSGAGMIPFNSTVSLVATPNTGYRFVNWTLDTSGGAVQSTSASYSFTASGTVTLVANFASISTDNFRSKTSGNWGDITTWQSSPDNSTWYDVNAIPTSSASSIIILPSHKVTITANATSPALTINSGGKLTLNSGSSLAVTGNFNINSDATNGTGTFVDENANGGLTVTGTTTVQQYLGAARNWYISSPVSTAKAQSAYTFYRRDEANNAWPLMNTGDGINTGDPLNVGQGYIANLASGTATYTFTGTLNSGATSITVNRTLLQANKPGFNLVGNPYPSYLNATTLINSNANLEKTIWYRTQKKSSTTYYFDTYNTAGKQGTNLSNNVNYISGTVAPMQAFWVRVSAGQSSATLNFSNSLRVQASALNDTINPLKVKNHIESSQQAIHLQVSNGVNNDETVLYANPAASNGYDIYDSEKMSNGSYSIPEIYSIADGQNLVINGLNTIPYDTEMPLGFTTGTAGSNFSIKASQLSNFDAGTQVILKDYLDSNNPVQADLSDGSAYTFSSDMTNNNTSRFALIFKAPSIATGINPESKSNVWISTRNGELMINGTIRSGVRLEVFNAIGQKVISRNLTTANALLNNTLATGAYLVKVTNEGKSVIKKVIID